jgi:protein TonB
MNVPMNLIACLVVAALCLAGCDSQPDRPRKQQMVKLLPDTPPPPPPPPKPEDKPPPKPEDKPQQQEAPKPVDTPAPQALKSDEAAGDGPGSGLSAGAVSKDYQGGAIGSQIGGGSPAENPGNALVFTAFANGATKALNEYLVRDKDVKRLDYKVRVELWLTPTGTLQRAELVGSTGDPQTDQALRAALERFPGTGNAPPARLPQPLRVLVSNRLLG